MKIFRTGFTEVVKNCQFNFIFCRFGHRLISALRDFYKNLLYQKIALLIIYGTSTDEWIGIVLCCEIKLRLGLLRRSRSSKVTEFGTNRKLICDFLLVINNNLAHILHRFRDMAFDNFEKSLYSASPLVFNSPDGVVPLGRSP